MDPIVQALITQRNTLASRCLDLELEIHARDEKIKMLEAVLAERPNGDDISSD